MRALVLRIIPLLFISCLSSAALAQGAFDGVNAQAGVGAAALDSNINWNDYGRYKYSHTGAMESAALGYSYGFDNRLNLAANVFWNFGTDDAGGTNLGGSKEQLRLNNVHGIAIEPGYYVSGNTLAYAKLGYAQASSRYEFIGSNTILARCAQGCMARASKRL
jgi:hypothetical protein